ncbi:MAG: bactofilin family protein [Thermodesulfobacteriota bacterium]
MWDKDKKESLVKYPKDKRDSEGKYPEEIPVTPQVQRLTNPERGEVVKIGKSIFIKGEVSGRQDLIIDGRVEGEIQLKENQVTIGEYGKISGEIHAKSIIIQGEVIGNMFAEEKIEIKTSGSLIGDISSPRLIIDDGAYFKGRIDMEVDGQRRLERPATEILEVVKSE